LKMISVLLAVVGVGALATDSERNHQQTLRRAEAAGIRKGNDAPAVDLAEAAEPTRSGEASFLQTSSMSEERKLHSHNWEQVDRMEDRIEEIQKRLKMPSAPYVAKPSMWDKIDSLQANIVRVGEKVLTIKNKHRDEGDKEEHHSFLGRNNGVEEGDKIHSMQVNIVAIREMVKTIKNKLWGAGTKVEHYWYVRVPVSLGEGTDAKLDSMEDNIDAIKMMVTDLDLTIPVAAATAARRETVKFPPDVVGGDKIHLNLSTGEHIVVEVPAGLSGGQAFAAGVSTVTVPPGVVGGDKIRLMLSTGGSIVVKVPAGLSEGGTFATSCPPPPLDVEAHTKLIKANARNAGREAGEADVARNRKAVDAGEAKPVKKTEETSTGQHAEPKRKETLLDTVGKTLGRRFGRRGKIEQETKE